MRLQDCLSRVSDNIASDPVGAGPAAAAQTVQAYIGRGPLLRPGPADSITRGRRESKLLGVARMSDDLRRRALVAALGPNTQPATAAGAMTLQLERAVAAARSGVWHEAANELELACRVCPALVALGHVAQAVRARADGDAGRFYHGLADASRRSDKRTWPLLDALVRAAMAQTSDDPVSESALRTTLGAAPADRHNFLWPAVLSASTAAVFVARVAAHPEAFGLSVMALGDAVLRMCWSEAKAAVDQALTAFAGKADASSVAFFTTIRSILDTRLAGDIPEFYRALDTVLPSAPEPASALLMPAVNAVIAHDVADAGTARALMSALPRAPRLQPEGVIARAMLAACVRVGQVPLHAALLDIGVGFVPPRTLIRDMTPELLEEVRKKRWHIAYYGRLDGVEKCLLSPVFREPLHVYQLHDMPLTRAVQQLRDLTEGGWSIVGARLVEEADAPTVLRALVFPSDGAMHDYHMEQHHRFGAGLHDVASRGVRLVAFMVRENQTLLIVDVADKRHCQYAWQPAVDLEATVRMELASGNVVCGLAGTIEREVPQLLVARPGGAAPGESEAASGHDAAVKELRAALTRGAWSRAARCLAALPQAPEAQVAPQNPWRKHRPVFAETIAKRATDPWPCVVALAQAALAETSVEAMCRGVGGFAADVVLIIRRLYEDCTDRAWVRMLTCMRVDATPDADVRHVLAAAVGHILKDGNFNRIGMLADFSEMTEAQIRCCISSNQPGIVSLLVRLGADLDGTRFGELSARQLALESGQLWLSEALDGNDAAGREAQRMGPRQRAMVAQCARQAVRLSAAAAPALEARLKALGEPAETAQALRHYLRRRAPLWINFQANCDNGLLRSEAYRSKGVGNASWADGYATAAPAESGVIYGWVNAQKSMTGYRRFGSAALVLQDHVRARVTVTARNKCTDVASVGTLHAMDHVLVEFSDLTLRSFLAAMRGKKKWRRHDVADADVIEMHIHGPLNMREDVRKINIATNVLLYDNDCRAFYDFAENNDLVVHWRSSRKFPASERDVWLRRLSRQRVDLNAWHHRHDSGKDVVFPRPGRLIEAETRQRNTLIYAEHSSRWEHQARTVADIGLGGDDIIGLSVAASPGDRRHVTFIARRNTRDAAARTYALHRTQLATERLENLGSQGWELMACHQATAELSVTPESFLVVRQSAQRWDYDWHKIRRGATYPDVTNVIAIQAKAGWQVAGIHCLDDKGAELIFKRPLPEDVPLPSTPPVPAHIVNDTTLMMDPLACVPEVFRFVTRDNYMFDIEELAALAEQKGSLVNGWTNSPLCEADVEKVLVHPSGAGARLAALMATNAVLLSRLKPPTAQALEALAAILEADPTTGDMNRSVQATDAFARYVQGPDVTTDERVAIYGAKFALVDTHGQAFNLSIMAAVTGLQTGAGCSLATSKYLREMASRIRASAAREI